MAKSKKEESLTSTVSKAIKGTFDLEKFKYGIGILQHIYDTRRGTDSSKIINDFTKFAGIKI